MKLGLKDLSNSHRLLSPDCPVATISTLKRHAMAPTSPTAAQKSPAPTDEKKNGTSPRRHARSRSVAVGAVSAYALRSQLAAGVNADSGIKQVLHTHMCFCV